MTVSIVPEPEVPDGSRREFRFERDTVTSDMAGDAASRHASMVPNKRPALLVD